MILFVFEGERREPVLYKTIQLLYFPKDNEQIICSFGNNLYELYRELQEYGGDGDLVRLLMDKFRNKTDNPFKNVNQRSSDFSEIYLFFDYDFHNSNLSLENLNSVVAAMLEMFSDESGNGKLYINYPMVESIRYTKQLPDADYQCYKVTREQCRNFKELAAQFSYYDSLDYIQLDQRKKPTEDQLTQLRQNWEYFKFQNVKKANFLCTDEEELPNSKDAINQATIFDNQLKKYVLNDDCSVSILNAFPLFLYDYFV